MGVLILCHLYSAVFNLCVFTSLCQGAGTDDETLIRVMATRCEVDMLDIRIEFRKLFACSLHSMIKVHAPRTHLSWSTTCSRGNLSHNILSVCLFQGDTSGDYRKALLLLCGGDEE